MEKNKSVVEDALLQIKAIEEAISENAKGILASTMKQEISELVKESLTGKKSLHEQDASEEPEMDDEEEDVDVDVDVDGPEMTDEPEMDDEEGVEEPEEVDTDIDMDVDTEFGDNEMPPLDMTHASPEEVLRVFKAMGDEDGIIVKKQDDGDIYLVDNNNNTEYLISMGGGSQETEPIDMMESYMDEEELDETWTEDEDEEELDESWLYESDDDDDDEEELDESDDDDEEELDESWSEEDEEEGAVFEIDAEALESVLESFKAKGVGMGKPGNGMSKTSVNMKGFKEDKKQGTKGVGMGKPKDVYPKNLKHGVTETELDEMDDEEEGEVKETVRTNNYVQAGKIARRRGTDMNKNRMDIRKPKNESVEKELQTLREKNEEYKKALDFFRSKLNEVAVFNSNLAYSTRLFTEHSTTKQEKINILRRFDNVQTIKESKNLYKTIKEELDGDSSTESINESVQRNVVKTPQNGSSTNLIESKTYENPQFLRMKDLMTKIK
jgi:hypothetical protein